MECRGTERLMMPRTTSTLPPHPGETTLRIPDTLRGSDDMVAAGRLG
jgi:hypothetical protein